MSTTSLIKTMYYSLLHSKILGKMQLWKNSDKSLVILSQQLMKIKEIHDNKFLCHKTSQSCEKPLKVGWAIKDPNGTMIITPHRGHCSRTCCFSASKNKVFVFLILLAICIAIVQILKTLLQFTLAIWKKVVLNQ